MKTLTNAQFDKVVILLTEQFKGKTIAFGDRYDYNKKEVISCDMEYVRERGHHYPNMKTKTILTTPQFRKSVSSLGIIDIIPTKYCEFYTFRKVNIQKLKTQYKNGSEAVLTALENV